MQNMPGMYSRSSDTVQRAIVVEGRQQFPSLSNKPAWQNNRIRTSILHLLTNLRSEMEGISLGEASEGMASSILRTASVSALSRDLE
jgi:hypothetical protein